jgi:hypothetical protein
MAKAIYKRGITSYKARVKINDTTSTTNGGKTGLTNASAGLVISTICDNEAAATSYSGANIETITAIGTYQAPSAGKIRFKEIDATNHPGWYEIHVADARMAVADARSIGFTVVVTGGSQVDWEVQLEPVPANAKQWRDTDIAAEDTAGYPKVTLKTGTGAGEVDMTSGVPKANLVQILGTVLTETAGQIAAAFKKFFDKASPTGTINSIPDAVPDAAGGLTTKTYLDGRTLASAVYATAAAQAALQTSLDDIPTNSEFNDRSLPTLQYGTAANQATLATAIAATATPAQVKTQADQALADAKAGYAIAIEAAILDEGDATALLAAIAAKVEEFLMNEGDAAATIQAIATAVTASVWANASRTLTSGVNIVLAKGVGLTGLNDISQSQVGNEAANALTVYDPPTKAELDAAQAALATAIGLTATPAQVLTQATAALNTYDPPTNAEMQLAFTALGDDVSDLHADVADYIAKFHGLLVDVNAVPWTFAGLATAGAQIQIIDWLEADWKLNVNTNPWQVESFKKGTSTLLGTKKLKEANNTPVTSFNQRVGQQVQ